MYDYAEPLNGAEADATGIYAALLNPEIGNYEPTASRLLRSPTLNELISDLRSVLSSVRQPDCLTIYFAGHGTVSRGTYYLWLRNTTPDMLSTTALGLPQLFAIVNEVEPSQCNIIIDACESGGLVTDLSTLIKPELLGNTNTPAISIFAASAANEGAAETEDGGIATVEILKYLNGQALAQSQRPFLDLVEIERAVSANITAKSGAQKPIVWGLNLLGESTFCRNPHYDAAKSSVIGALASIPKSSEAGRAIDLYRDDLWRLFYEVQQTSHGKMVLELLPKILQGFGTSDHMIGSFVLGYARTLSLRAQGLDNTFFAAELLAACGAALMPYGNKPGVDEAILLISIEMADQIANALDELKSELDNYDFALIRHGLPELYYLPIRVTRILGWIGAITIITDELKFSDRNYDFLPIVRQILQKYSASLASVSDSQSPFVLLFMEAALRRDWKEEAEIVFGYLFSDIVRAKGRISDPNISSEDVFKFLHGRIEGKFVAASDILSQPMELLAVLMMSAHLFALENLVDPWLSDIDHLSFNVFLPTSHLDFALETIRDGTNHSFQIGHGVWSVRDFILRWIHSCVPQLSSDSTLAAKATRISAVCSTLTLPDRTPWYLWASRAKP